MEQGYSDEIAVGDPAILVPLLYEPNSKPSGDIAVIPQHRDAQAPIFRMIAEMEGFRLIDICTDIEDFCDQLTGCRGVVSSSLHAVVAAHGYKIPARFIKVSDNPLGDGFKLLDYLSSVGLDDDTPVICTGVDDIRRAADTVELPRHYPDIEKLLSSCPFIKPSIKPDWIARASAHFRY